MLTCGWIAGWVYHERAYRSSILGTLDVGYKTTRLRHFLSWWFLTEGKMKRNGGRLAEERGTSPQGKGVWLTLGGANVREVLEPSLMESCKTQTFCILTHLCPLPGVKALNWVLKQVLRDRKFSHFGLKRSVVGTILRLRWSQVNGFTLNG